MVLSCSCANIIVPSLFLYFSVLMGSGFFLIIMLKYFLCEISCSFFALSPYARWRASCCCSLWNYFYVVGDWYVFPCFPSFLEGKIYRFHWFTDSSTWDLFFWFPSKLPAWLLKSIDRKSHSTNLLTSDLFNASCCYIPQSGLVAGCCSSAYFLQRHCTTSSYRVCDRL